MAQRYKFNGTELEESLGVNLYEMDMRQYDPAIARWTSIDPVVHFEYSPYNAFDNNPVFWADPSGGDSESWATKYVDSNGEVILNTDDGSDDVIVVPDRKLPDFKELIKYTHPNLYNSKVWNDHFKSEFLGLDSDKMNSLLDGFSTQWSRQKAINYIQDPTGENAVAMSYAEALSQWTDPQKVLGAASVMAAMHPRVKADGIIYLRTDKTGGTKPYVGQAKNEARYLARQKEHARANPNADFEFKVIDNGSAKGLHWM